MTSSKTPLLLARELAAIALLTDGGGIPPEEARKLRDRTLNALIMALMRQDGRFTKLHVANEPSKPEAAEQIARGVLYGSGRDPRAERPREFVPVDITYEVCATHGPQTCEITINGVTHRFERDDAESLPVFNKRITGRFEHDVSLYNYISEAISTCMNEWETRRRAQANGG